jgi:cytochrome c553
MTRLTKFVAATLAVATISASIPTALAQEALPIPLWAYPTNPPDFKLTPDDGVPRRVPGSNATYTVTQLRDRFVTHDWHPQEHPPMPEVVSQGRKPEVFACGFCHRVHGTGGPENANLAGLPYTYILRQMQDYKSGARSTAVPKRAPTSLMMTTARAITDAEIEAAAAYFSKLKPFARIRVLESATAPQTFVANWFFAAVPRGATEPLGQRIVEVPDDLEQFEARDSHARFIVYAPLGSVAKGEALVKTGAGKTVPCAACHGQNLKGADDIPPIAGHSPTYMVRQLYELKAGIRHGSKADQMKPVVTNLTMDDVIAIAAYLSTQEP